MNDYFLVLRLVHLPFEQGIPYLLEQLSNKNNGTILAQVSNLRCSKKGHNSVPHGYSLRLTNVHLMYHRKVILIVENYFILINRITQNIDKEYEFFSDRDSFDRN